MHGMSLPQKNVPTEKCSGREMLCQRNDAATGMGADSRMSGEGQRPKDAADESLHGGAIGSEIPDSLLDSALDDFTLDDVALEDRDAITIELGDGLEADLGNRLRVEAGLDWFALRAALHRAVVATLQAVDKVDGELTLLIVDDAEVRTLNRDYRGIDAPTDVLSFPMLDEPADISTGGDEAEPHLIVAQEAASAVDNYLGDIVIALPYSQRQALRYGNSIRGELCLLAVHGTLHLLGYDHDTPPREARMWALQDAILRTLGEAIVARRDFDDS